MALLKIFNGYGSFFGLTHPVSRILLALTTMLHPATGLSGLFCAALVLAARRLLSFPGDGDLDIVNGLLFGMLIGSLFAPSPASIVVLSLGAILIVLLTVCLSDTITKNLRLPVLGLPYVFTGYIMLPIAAHLGLTPITDQALFPTTLPGPIGTLLNLFAPLGSLYFCGTAIGGLLVFIAFAFSSRYLALLTLGAGILCNIFLHSLRFTTLLHQGNFFAEATAGSISAWSNLFETNPLPLLIAQMNGVLTAGVIGGLYSVPSPRSLTVAAGAAIMACLLTILLQQPLFYGAPVLPPLALPFVLSTYVVLLALSTNRGGPWLRFWLLVPALPELSLERLTIGRARGVDLHSVALRSPVKGAWQIYQGFDGDYTHRGPWRYALDFIQTENGLSYRDEGKTLTDYYSYCKPVFAPGWGTVTALVNSCPDNRPGDVEIKMNWGNYLLIRLDSGHYAMLAHLQKGSIRVGLHSRVEPGQIIALVGNSGRSPQPHLHLHIQGSPELGAATLPFHLSHVILSSNESIAKTELNADTAASAGSGLNFPEIPVSKFEKFELNACPAQGETIKSTTRNTALARALHLSLGRCFEYSVKTPAGSHHQRLSIKLDLTGQFYLETETETKTKNGKRTAATAFTVNEDLAAFFDTDGTDKLITAFVLALGLTPLTEGNLNWIDQVPVRLLPASRPVKMLWSLLHPFSPCVESHYTRHWDGGEMLWKQQGVHRLRFNAGWEECWHTEAQLSELSGIIALSIKDGRNRELLTARLDGWGVKEDNGIPETMLNLR